MKGDVVDLLEIGIWIALVLFIMLPGAFFAWLARLDVRDRRRHDGAEATRRVPRRASRRAL